MATIDINCDVGEGIGNEELLMPYISSCNIACGAHAGDVKTIDRVIATAQKHQVKIGAHPSFPDRENFGRKVMNISLEELKASLKQQIVLIQERLGTEKLNHIKAHGALYNLAAVDKDIAHAIIHVAKNTAPDAILFVPFNSAIATLAIEQHLNIMYEVFADRNYRNDLTLVPRTQKDAVITNKTEVVNHLLRMIVDQKVRTASGNLLPIKADTCCVHGDNQAALEIVKHIHQSLTQKKIAIA